MWKSLSWSLQKILWLRWSHCIIWKAQSQNFLWFIELNMVTYIPFNERLCALFRSLSEDLSIHPKLVVSFYCTKREDFYTHYFIEVLVYAVISRHSIFKSIIWRLSSWKTIIPRISLICVLFLNKLYTPKVIVQNVPKWNVFVKLPFLGSTLCQIWKNFQKLFYDKLASCNLKIVFTSHVRVKSFFTLKDKWSKMLLSELVYKY